MPAQNTTKPAPTNKVSLNLDALEREGAQDEPFVIWHLDREYIFADAQELDWQELMKALQDPRKFFRLTLGEAANEFLGQPMSTWKLRRLMNDYRDYYGLVEPGE